MPDAQTHILVTGAREHNLQGVDVALPRDALTVITGLSGSGKSSLAFDTVYQEGQRRYLESLSAYARQFLGPMEKPRVDRVEGLSPTLAIDQRTASRNPRSTVGTVTEVLDHLRLLFARLGTPHCPTCGRVIAGSTAVQIRDRLMADHLGSRLLVMGPVVRERKGEYRKELSQLLSEGWLRARIDGQVRGLDEPIDLARYEKHTIEVVVDRLRLPAPGEAPGDLPLRLLEALEKSLVLGKGIATVLVDDSHHREFTTTRSCPDHDVHLPELEPRLFSFNAPQGACPDCEGLGVQEGFETRSLMDPSLPAFQACRVFQKGRLAFSSYLDERFLARVIRDLGADPATPWGQLPPEVQRGVLFGAPLVYTVRRVFDPSSDSFLGEDVQARKEVVETEWKGIVPFLDWLWRFVHPAHWEGFRRTERCPACGGTRLHPLARAVTFRDQSLPHLLSLSVVDARRFFASVTFSPHDRAIGDPILKEIRHRLDFLHEVGLGYLTLDRGTATLSGGEAQRIRLAAQVGSGLQGVTYVLDEPSIGLHPIDNRKLLDSLGRLRDQGNTVLVVEHDAETMLSADHLVEVGPGAGRGGGRITAQGAPASFARQPGVTSSWLRGTERIPVPGSRRPGNGQHLVIRGARAHNLRSIDVPIPLGTFTAVTGVSGSGKSTLLFGILEPALAKALHGARRSPEAHDRIDGLEHLDKVICIDQDPIGRTPRSNPATYTGVFDDIRALFAQVPEARARGYKPGRFSFNVPGGRCEACKGAGVLTLEMQFLADVEVPCEDCEGRRFNAETLEIRWRGRTITDVLEMPISEACAFFARHKKILRGLQTLDQVGLGYVTLGQPSTTLSGGEAQRIKLARELQRPPTGRTLYLLDEPTTGLHFADIARLLAALQSLVDAGNTVVVIEHNLDMVKCADHLLDLGPGGGAEGGLLVGAGTPEHVSGLDTPTGRVLASLPELHGLSEPPILAAEERVRPLGLHGRDIVIRGAARHNLQHIDVRIPQGRLTVVTGVSGSGKSSLALHTLFSEGQRRYVESLSTYARRFLGRMDPAPVDRVDGLAPAIAIEQRSAATNPRSTVATVTEIYDSLRLLWARIGRPHCHRCGEAVLGVDPTAAARYLLERNPGLGALVADLPPSPNAQVLRQDLQREGLTRLFTGTEAVDLEDPRAHDLLVAGASLRVDRFDPATAEASRVEEAVRVAYGWGRDQARFLPQDGSPPLPLSLKPRCPTHGFVLPQAITPRHFSFNSHVGACPTCAGTGEARVLDRRLLFPRPHLGFFDAMDGRVAAVLRKAPRIGAMIRAALQARGAQETTPVENLPPGTLDYLMEGGEPAWLAISWEKPWETRANRVDEKVLWKGILPVMAGWRSSLDWLHHAGPCPTCGGGRLQPALLGVRVGGLGIHQLCALTVRQALAFLEHLPLTVQEARITDQLLPELRNRLGFLRDVGLDYLTLDRSAHSLSGGESQRIRLASQLGTRLTDTIYVLDEPTIGLHPRDTARLLDTLEGLRDAGNTVVVVEHDLDTIRRADHVLDLGPGAGEHGGHVVAAGSPAEIARVPESLTGAFLEGRRIPVPPTRPTAGPPIQIRGATANNLKGIDVDFPTGMLTVVTGVSGSGKSSLVMDTLAPALLGALDPSQPTFPPCQEVRLPPGLDRVVVVDQSPIGRTPRSCPATYTRVLDGLRKLFVQVPEAQVQGLDAGSFSFNAHGRCPACEGRGATLVEMHFLSDVWVPCDECKGTRYSERVLQVRWQDHSIADVLQLPVSQALDLFRNHRSIRKDLQALHDVGLGYLRLGQPATTLSGGEAQRVKLATELAGRPAGAVYLLDEPTTGLHLADVERLLDVFHRLVDQGATLVVIEHHPDVIRAAGHIVDLGPEGGQEGGRVVVAGDLDAVRACAASHTGRAVS